MEDPEADVRAKLEQEINRSLEASQSVLVHWVAFADLLDVKTGERGVVRVKGDGTPDWIADALPDQFLPDEEDAED